MLGELLDNELFWVLLLSAYVLAITYLTKNLYSWMISHVYKKEIAIYYNRKLIHIFAGGVVVLVVPFVFRSPWYPLLAGIVLGIITYITHRSGKLLYWFQTKKDFNDVTFCFMWGLAIFILWQFLGNKWIAIIPPAFIAFGDGITGIIRNLAFHERKKHPIGNVYMAGICIPIGYFFANVAGLAIWGVLAAIVASFFERFEFGHIDDNILITVSSTAILFIGGHISMIV
ncbi:MAG TPA: hypothetical protein ENN45_00420 [Bacteroidetes bacterium]|nr:hypothetical protein [Bacteroidota bacterium]